MSEKMEMNAMKTSILGQKKIVLYGSIECLVLQCKKNSEKCLCSHHNNTALNCLIKKYSCLIFIGHF